MMKVPNPRFFGRKAFPVLLILVLLLVAAGCITTAEDWNQRGETHHTMGRYEEAVAAFDQAIAIDPGYAEAWRNRGLSLALLGRVNESETSFSKAISLDPDDASIYYYQALSRNATGNRAGALESLDRAVSIRPQSRDQTITLHSSLLLQGDLLFLDGRIAEANLSYQKAHEVMMSTI
jgi:tetratricopeptide (TPR) repeat protein